jgi:phage baseplate assembly protein W
MAEKFINIKFPFQDDTKGKYLRMTKKSDEAIKSDLIHLLLTNKGERLYLPEFGTNLRQYLFEPNLDEVRANIKEEVEEAIKKFIPNLVVSELTVTKPEEGDPQITEHTAVVRIDYVVTQGAFQKSDFVTIKI